MDAIVAIINYDFMIPLSLVDAEPWRNFQHVSAI